MKRILFVCTGNTCRSPMAEGLFRNGISNKYIKNNYEGCSAGVYATNLAPPSEDAVHALKQLNIDISNHRARRISTEIMKDSDIVIGMTVSHKAELLSSFPEFSEKIFTLYEFVNEDSNKNVNDPYGMPLDIYLSCASELRDAIEIIIKKLEYHLT